MARLSADEDTRMEEITMILFRLNRKSADYGCGVCMMNSPAQKKRG
jgi:hypothetical protein